MVNYLHYTSSSHPSTTLPTLDAYLDAAHALLALILQIPPTAPAQAALRTAFLLRLTGDILTSVTGYAPSSSSSALSPEGVDRDKDADMEDGEGAEQKENEGDEFGDGNGKEGRQDTNTPLHHLLALLTELDNGWYAVLRAQAWDARTHSGVDVEIPLPLLIPSLSGSGFDSGPPDSSAESSIVGAPPVSQTDRTRLRSILASGASRLEAWLEKSLSSHVAGTVADVEVTVDAGDQDQDEAQDVDLDLEQLLAHLGLQQAFDDLFVRTLAEMGEFAEAMARVDVPPLLSPC